MRNKYLDLSVGAMVRKVGLALAVFVITFGVVSSIRNAGGTYAADDSACYYCPSSSVAKWSSGVPTDTCNSTWTFASAITSESNCVTKKITFLLNDGTIESGSTERYILYGETLTFPSATKNGFAFGGWVAGDGSVYHAGDRIEVTMNQSFRAEWISGSCYYCPSSSVAKWSVGEPTDTCNSIWTPETAITSQSNCVTRTVTFNLDGGSMSGETTKIVLNGHKITLPNPTRKGYNFSSWQTTEGTNDVGYKPGDVVTITSNKVFNASWSKVDENIDPGFSNGSDVAPDSSSENVEFVTVKFNANGGEVSTTQKMCEIKSGNNSCEVDFPTASKDSYEHIGWSLSKECSNLVTGKATVTREEGGKKTYYACYDLVEDNTDNNNNSEPGENPNTGSRMLYIVYLVGILSLGYTGYYSYKTIKSRNN